MPAINLEAEQYLLGCLLVEGELIKEIGVHPEHFYSLKNRIIFESMKAMEKSNEPIDLPTLILKLKDRDEEIGGLNYLMDLRSSIASVEPYKTYERYVLDSWKLRQAELIANKMRDAAEIAKDASIISESIQQLCRLEEIGHDSDFDLRDLLIRMYEDMQKERGELTGVDTGFSDLNDMTSGLQKQDLIILAARPSVGKTAFALNIAHHSCEKDTVTSIFSLEMSQESLMKRILSAVGNINSSKMKNPKLMFDPDDWSKLKQAMRIVNKYPIFIYDNPNVTLQDIRAKVRALKRRFPDQNHICIIDYLQLIKGTDNENRQQQVAEISRSLKIMAREFDMPFVVLSQLSRSVEQRQNKRPMLSDLRESGSIEQDADIIAFLYRDDYYDKESEEKNVIEVIIAKQRNGPTGTVKLAFVKEYSKFINLDQSR